MLTTDCLPIRHVSDTALWVAMYRAFESERPDALFDDPHARRLAGERGAAIVNAVPGGQAMAWAMTVRTAVIDELVLDCVARGVRTVINLGAGLDTRAFRLLLPPELGWLDVDLPAMIAYRRDCLDENQATCRHQHIAADITDATAMQAVLAAARKLSAHGHKSSPAPLLVISEGLLLYLDDMQVASLARQLHAETGMRWWISDVISPLLLNTVSPVWRSQLPASAPFRFAPADRAAFFGPLGWQEQQFRSTWDESLRLNRPSPTAAFWTAFVKPCLPGAHEILRQSSGVALLEAQR